MDAYDIYAHQMFQKAIEANRRETGRVDDAVVQIEARLRALEMTNKALWTLLKTKNGYTDEELFAELDSQGDAGARGLCVLRA